MEEMKEGKECPACGKGSIVMNGGAIGLYCSNGVNCKYPEPVFVENNRSTNMEENNKVNGATFTRVEIIDNAGRAYVKYARAICAVQDHGATLKIFIDDKHPNNVDDKLDVTIEGQNNE